MDTSTLPTATADRNLAERRVIARALRINALLIEMDADWAKSEGRDADDLRRMAREICPEGAGVILEEGE